MQIQSLHYNKSNTKNIQTIILAFMSIRLAVYTHCQMNENPCSNQEIHVLYEHGSELENTKNEPCIICMTLYTESVVDQTIVANMKHASTYSPVAFRSVHTGI